MKSQVFFNHHNPLSISELPASVQAERPWPSVSKKYQFLSTLEVTRALESVGLFPYCVRQAGTRIEGKEGYTKHLLRFRGLNIPALKGNVYPEVVLLNAHDRASAFILEIGLFRMICANGLVVSFGDWGKYRIRHIASSLSDVLVAAESIVELFPMIEAKVARLQDLTLTATQAFAFAERALSLRWEAGKEPFSPERLLTTRRYEDSGKDAWSILNVVQENLLQGQHIYSRLGGERRERSSRRVNSIDVTMQINKGLWELAESL